MKGSTKFAVPTWTAVGAGDHEFERVTRVGDAAHADRRGCFTAHGTRSTMRTAIGRIAGPLRPPTTFEIFGRRVSTSITMARNVLTSDTASAPASSAARARTTRHRSRSASAWG